MRSLNNPSNPVMLVDDEAHILASLSVVLNSAGISNIITCQDSTQVMKLLSEQLVEVLLLDLTMPRMSGQDLLPGIREEYPDMPVIVITGMSDVSTAVECMKLGVFDYLIKAVEPSKLIAAVNRAIEIRELKQEIDSLRQHLVNGQFEQADVLTGFIVNDDKMRSTLMYVESIAASSQTVLITGETGVGKELVAGAIHKLSGREGEFVPVNIAGLDDAMFADTLFGHTKGAYTGAERARPGLIEKSAGGTLFLDEIGDMNAATQIRLLRLLEGGEYYPLGSDIAKRSDARIVVATNRDLMQKIQDETFRKDLYYRLKTHLVHVPPLRERAADLPLLVDFFVQEAADELQIRAPGVSPNLFSTLAHYSFPGNVRELRSIIFDAVSKQKSGHLSLRAVREAVGESENQPQVVQDEALFTGVYRLPTIKNATEQLIGEALDRSNGNQSLAARILGISPQAMSKRLKNRKS